MCTKFYESQSEHHFFIFKIYNSVRDRNYLEKSAPPKRRNVPTRPPKYDKNDARTCEDRQTDRKTDRQTDKQTNTQTNQLRDDP